MRDYFFDGKVRLDWGFGNPNITAALIALIMVGVWIFAFWGRWGFWLSLVINLAMGVFLAQTFSRGGIVALMAGLIPVALAARPWRVSRLVPVVAGAIVLSIYAGHLGATRRYAKGLVEEDASVGNRWIIYKTVPRMIWDAPAGWGKGRSGDAFRQWYQPVGRLERYQHLISSHATILVESGWLRRIGYISGWIAALGLCLPWGRKTRKWFSVPLGLLIAFGIAGSFSGLYDEWILWSLPLAGLVAVIVARAWKVGWPRLGRCLATLGIGNAAFAASIILLTLVGSSPIAVTLRGGVVHLSMGKRAGREVSLLCVDSKVLGEFYGHRIREAMTNAPGESSCRDVSVVWKQGAKVAVKDRWAILAGSGVASIPADIAASLGDAARVIFLNPSEPSPALLKAASRLPGADVLFGERFAEPGRYVWEALAAKSPRLRMLNIPIAATFLPEWVKSMDEQLGQDFQKHE